MNGWRWLLAIGLLLGTLWGAGAGFAQASGEVLVLTVEGPVTPAMGSYLARGLREAEARDAELLVLRLDTPGGSVEVMGQLVRQLSNATVPTLVYVWPSGARAASAGTFLTLSADLAAMAPQTTIGAASVVGGGGEELDETLSRKLTNDLTAAIRAQSERRGAEAVRWAERAITEAVAANEAEARQIGVVDFVARDLPDLLAQADGTAVELASGETVTLALRDRPVHELPMSLPEQFLHLITDPSIALLLLSLGGLAIYFEFAAPGGYVGGIFGVIALLLGFYALGSLEADWAGLGLLLFAFILFALELKTAAHGLFAVGGLAAFVFGAMLLFQSSYLAIPVPLIVLLALAVAGFMLFAVAAALRSRKQPVITGHEGLVGKVGQARTALEPEREGMVFVEGELWKAYSPVPLAPGSFVRVVARRGLHLEVEPAERRSPLPAQL